MRRLSLMILAAAMPALAIAPASAAIPQSEREVLLALHAATNGDGWGNDFGWGGPPGTECSWYGITCDVAQAHVTYIDLSVNNLVGTLPPLANLTRLVSFVAVNNQLSGPIPPLAGLTRLEFLQLNFNELTGPIPPLTGLADLQFVGLDYNQLSGSIPSLAGLSNLQSFDVTSNRLGGAVPSLAGLTALTVLRIGDNQLSGPMPGVPVPSALFDGASQLCPNYLDRVANSAWDAATGETPWHQACTDVPDLIYADGFDGP